MSLPPSARLANIKDSLKKFARDSFDDAQGIYTTFDVTLAPPTVNDRKVDRWICFRVGPRGMSSAGFQVMEIFCCTVRDPEGFRLAQLRDLVVGSLVNTGGETDTFGRIPFYRSYPSAPWERIGALVVQEIDESDELKGPDLTLYIVLTVRLWFGAGI